MKFNLNLVFQKYPIAVVYLFGSRAKNEAEPNSDYDFGILLKEDVDNENFSINKFSLLKELIRTIQKPVDVIILNDKETPLSLKYRIIKEGIILYETDSTQRNKFEIEIIDLYLDRKYYYDRHIKEAIINFASGGLS